MSIYYDSPTYEMGVYWEGEVKKFFENKGYHVNINIFDAVGGGTTQRKIIDGCEYIYPDLSLSITIGSDVEFYIEVKSHSKFYQNSYGNYPQSKLDPKNKFVFISKYKFDFYKKFQEKFGKKVYVVFVVGRDGYRSAAKLFSSNITWMNKVKTFQKGYPFGDGFYPDGRKKKKESLYFWNKDDLKEVLW